MNIDSIVTGEGPIISASIRFTVSEIASLIAAIALLPPTHSSVVVLKMLQAQFPTVQPAAV